MYYFYFILLIYLHCFPCTFRNWLSAARQRDRTRAWTAESNLKIC